MNKPAQSHQLALSFFLSSLGTQNSALVTIFLSTPTHPGLVLQSR